MTWGELPWDKVHANITHYVIQWFNRSSQQSEGNATVASNIFLHVIRDLEVYKNYSVRVQAKANLGSGPFSSLVNTTTHQPGSLNSLISIDTKKIVKKNGLLEKYFKIDQRKVEETEICYRYLKREILQI